MTDACVLAEGSEDGSLHWVESPTGPRKFAIKVLVWDGHQKFFRRYETHKYVQTSGWRYIGPTSPDDAQALAESLAEAERLRDYIDAQRTDNERLQVDLYGARKDRDSWRRAAEEFRTETFAAETKVAALEAQNAVLREALTNVACSASWDNKDSIECMARAALAQSSGGEVSGE